jgi:hypothetical protein
LVEERTGEAFEFDERLTVVGSNAARPEVVDFLVGMVPRTDGIPAVRSVLTFLAAIGAVWALDYSVFEGWVIDVRAPSAQHGSNRRSIA